MRRSWAVLPVVILMVMPVAVRAAEEGDFDAALKYLAASGGPKEKGLAKRVERRQQGRALEGQVGRGRRQGPLHQLRQDLGRCGEGRRHPGHAGAGRPGLRRQGAA